MIAIEQRPQIEGMTLGGPQTFPPVLIILASLGLLFLTCASLAVLFLPQAQALVHGLLQTFAFEAHH